MGYGLLKIACYYPQKTLNSQRGQFWGRAALAPVVLLRIRALLFGAMLDGVAQVERGREKYEA